MRLKLMLCCHDHRLLLKKLSHWTTSWKSVVCKQLYESLLFHFLCVVETILKEELLKAPFHLLFYFKGYGKGWKWNYRLAMKIDDFSPLLNCWVCGLAWNSKFDILDGKSGIYMFDGIRLPPHRRSSFPILSLQSFAHNTQYVRLLKARKCVPKILTKNHWPNVIEDNCIIQHCNFNFFYLGHRGFVWLKKICPLGTVFIIKENWRGISTLHSLATLHLPTFFS